jgi:hypothetical protein
MNPIRKWIVLPALLLAGTAALALPAAARVQEGDPDYDGLMELEQEFQVGPYAQQTAGVKPSARPTAIPDLFGNGAVLKVGNLIMKVTNYGLVGNPFTNISSDPSGQWPGASGVEYLNFLAIAVGAVNPLASDPAAVRRVSYLGSGEWRPPTLDPEDRMYRAYDGIVGGARYINDDSDTDPLTGDPAIDEDFLDGRDNDGDGRIDEDFGAIGQQEYTCIIRDDTPQAVQAAAAERHVPLGIEIQQSAWAYSIPGYTDFDVVEFDIYNRSGHILDSVFVGVRTDMDCGPLEKGNYYSDDFGFPTFPQGDFWVQTKEDDERLQAPANHANINGVDADSALCPRYKLRVQGWSVLDDDGDEGKTPGVPTVMLIDHSIDPTGVSGPPRVGFRAFRQFTGGTPYTQGGAPTIDQQRFEFMASNENVDPTTGFINKPQSDQKGDQSEWTSIGPWRNLPDNGHVTLTVAIGVAPGTYKSGTIQRYPAAYQAVFDQTSGAVPNAQALLENYPSLANCFAAQMAFEGKYDETTWPGLADFHGREFCLKAPPGQFLTLQGCVDRDPAPRLVSDRQYECFDMDCDYCTGAYDFSKKRGLFHRHWLAEAPPPSPTTNMALQYNYSDNPDRRFPPAGDGQVTVAWDNSSETSIDPKSAQFDFRGYRVWKVSNWQRPVGSGGPGEDDWTLLAEYRLFDYAATNRAPNNCPPESVLAGNCTAADTLCPLVFIPQTGVYKRICLTGGDIWDRQSGDIIHPDPSVLCQGWPTCEQASGFANGQSSGDPIFKTKYPIGRYRYVDHNVKNGFVYFYSVTAFDSTGSGDKISELASRRSAVESEGVVPQVGVDTKTSGKHVWVVPNPYRGERFINNRPSAWDLTPNATDPTGTHVDFFGLPAGRWRIKIFTVSGDLVVELNSTDAVNESVRGEVIDASGTRHPGYNRQQDNANDGQARWNLISRNGQDVVSGIYLFTVELGGSVIQRGKFVIIR